MNLSMHGVNIAAALVGTVTVALVSGLALQSPTLAALPISLPWHADAGVLACLSCLSALLILLLWREQHHSAKIDMLRQALNVESRLRCGAEQSLLDTHGQLRKLRLQQEKIRKNERWRIARDIHDDLGQHLLALKMDISMLQVTTAALHPHLQAKLTLISGNVDMSVRSLRAIINDLRPIVLDAGLRIAIERQLDEFMRSYDVSVELSAGPSVFTDSGSKDIDTIVFRIVQETLSNIARHAQAKNVAITLDIESTSLVMTVSDDGIGMRAGPRSLGRGLRGIEDRITAAGGTLRIDSQPGRGTTLSLSIPLPASRVDSVAWPQAAC